MGNKKISVLTHSFTKKLGQEKTVPGELKYNKLYITN